MNYWFTLRHCIIHVYTCSTRPSHEEYAALVWIALMWTDRWTPDCMYGSSSPLSWFLMTKSFCLQRWGNSGMASSKTKNNYNGIHNSFWMKCGIISGSSRRSILHMNTPHAPQHHLLRSCRSSPSITPHPGAFGPWFCSVVAHFVAASHSKP